MPQKKGGLLCPYLIWCDGLSVVVRRLKGHGRLYGVYSEGFVWLPLKLNAFSMVGWIIENREGLHVDGTSCFILNFVVLDLPHFSRRKPIFAPIFYVQTVYK